MSTVADNLRVEFLTNVPTTPRYSTRPLPPYSYVPGYTPHPLSDPRGHMHGRVAETAPPLDPEHWRASETYRYAIDLFNYGYYWEAHEAWESLWHAAGRRGPTAVWLKALIKLAAAGVKLREGNPRGGIHHANRVKELIEELRTSGASISPDFNLAGSRLVPPSPSQTIYCGLASDQLEAAADYIARAAADGPRPDPARRIEVQLVLQTTR